ncbi:MAG: hypothetical protein ACLUOI_01895 [Eisenbergiella sp.]
MIAILLMTIPGAGYPGSLMAFYPVKITHKREAHEARFLVKGGKCGCISTFI